MSDVPILDKEVNDWGKDEQEEALMSKIFDQGTASVIPALKEYYGINFNVPLDTEVKMGYDWLNMKEDKYAN